MWPRGPVRILPTSKVWCQHLPITVKKSCQLFRRYFWDRHQDLSFLGKTNIAHQLTMTYLRAGEAGARDCPTWVQFDNSVRFRDESGLRPVPAHRRLTLFTQRNQKTNVKPNACDANCRY